MNTPASAAAVVETGPELNPALDPAILATEFGARGRVHIPAILTEASAVRLYRALREETPWRLTLNKGGDFLDFPSVTPEERNRIALGAWERAQTQFQYLFENHRLSHDGEPYPDPAHHLAKAVAFLNSPPLLAFARRVTGLETIARADAQATVYRPGDFLTQHDDRYGGRNRLAAYVLNLTPNWRPDWGGVLQFYDARGQIEEGYVPAFNALNIFRVPKWHSVSQVAIFGGFRYSITGWFHTK